ncbi:MAG: hypothetical protein JOY61_26885 [Chloroflexi bacterium]|nr:hypothetical protein [Chloroflexota bacterium]
MFQQSDWSAGLTQTDAAASAYLWAQVLRALEMYLESGTPQPLFGPKRS